LGEAASIEAPHDEQRDAFAAFLKPQAAQINGLAEPDAMGPQASERGRGPQALATPSTARQLTEHP